MDESAHRIAYGNNVCTFTSAPDVENNCVACFAPGNLTARNKWCINPDACWKAAKDLAHARVDNFESEKCKGTDPSKID